MKESSYCSCCHRACSAVESNDMAGFYRHGAVTTYFQESSCCGEPLVSRVEALVGYLLQRSYRRPDPGLALNQN